MAGVEKVKQQSFQQPFLNGRNTGYIALGAVGITALSSLIKPARKYHAALGIVALGASVLHLTKILNFKKSFNTKKEFIA